MFDQADVGLEVRLDDLAKCVSEGITIRDVHNVVTLLEFARLVRRSTKISFVHRRFNEYFLALAMSSGLHAVDLVTITDDRRDRDAVVLYTELCNDVEALKVVEYCSEAIPDSVEPVFNLGSTYSIRFLIEAFANRRDLLHVIEGKMFAVASGALDNLPAGLLSAKISVESTGVLTEAHASLLIQKAVEGQNGWIIETAVRD
jgi:hypothetical protein